MTLARLSPSMAGDTCTWPASVEEPGQRSPHLRLRAGGVWSVPFRRKGMGVPFHTHVPSSRRSTKENSDNGSRCPVPGTFTQQRGRLCCQSLPRGRLDDLDAGVSRHRSNGGEVSSPTVVRTRREVCRISGDGSEVRTCQRSCIQVRRQLRESRYLMPSPFDSLYGFKKCPQVTGMTRVFCPPTLHRARRGMVSSTRCGARQGIRSSAWTEDTFSRVARYSCI